MTAMSNLVSYWGRGIFAIVFIIAVAIIARILSAYGRRFLNHTFKSDDAIVQPVHILLNLGFYLLCIGLFLWNIGVGGSSDSQENIYFQVIEDAALRLGISILVVGAFHSINILVLAILNRKNS
ncbi:MAG TPA: hypothetical protein VGT03_15605 [Candidatus Acidoferrales bacterium]|nr:hypothetical protein [Candidatus Acidoferrales bacterium]